MYFSDGGRENVFLATFLLRSPRPIGVKTISAVDSELYMLFFIFYNITSLHHNTNLFQWKLLIKIVT